MLCLQEVCPMHSLLILVLILDALIAVSSVLNLVNMMRVNLMVEERRAEALTVQLVRVCLGCTPAPGRSALVSLPPPTPTAAQRPCPKPPRWCP